SLRAVFLIAFTLVLSGCGSLTEDRKTYNLDGSLREEVKVKARTFLVKRGLEGLKLEITGGPNDISRTLSVNTYDTDVSTNAGPVISAGGAAVGKVIGEAAKAAVKP
ncbi:MAG: hypothetical protein VW338_03555, partial [Rhodospirillaceae bacterium]